MADRSKPRLTRTEGAARFVRNPNHLDSIWEEQWPDLHCCRINMRDPGSDRVLAKYLAPFGYDKEIPQYKVVAEGSKNLELTGGAEWDVLGCPLEDWRDYQQMLRERNRAMNTAQHTVSTEGSLTAEEKVFLGAPVNMGPRVVRDNPDR